MHLILGSSSPRRKEILSYFSYPFKQASPPFDEDSIPFVGDPVSYVTTLALEKGHSLKKAYPHDVILTADTVVFVEGDVLGKPKTEEEMVAMLTRLSSRWHSVYTAVAVISPKIVLSEYEETRVLFNTLTPDDIHRYMRSHSLFDKAGAYAIQSSGSLIVKRIEGCYYNVMGLPVNTLRKVLEQAGIDLWNHLKTF